MLKRQKQEDNEMIKHLYKEFDTLVKLDGDVRLERAPALWTLSSFLLPESQMQRVAAAIFFYYPLGKKKRS